MCFCRRRYPSCNVRAPYCRLRPVRLYHAFSHCLINGTVFGGGITEHKMCFGFLCNVFVKHLQFQEEFGEIQMYIGLHVMCQLFLLDSNGI